MRALLCTLALACDTAPAPSCEYEVCSLVPECYPPLITGPWDWHSRPACLDSFSCGAEPERCLSAVEALACLSPTSTWSELEDVMAGLVTVRFACGVAR